MITLSLKTEERPVRIMPKEGFVYQNTKGNYFLVVNADEDRHSATGITFNSVTGKLMDMHSYAHHCICKWPLVGRAVDMPLIQVQEITPEEICGLEKYRGML